MRTVPTFVQGFVDYLAGIVLLITPTYFGFAAQGGAPVAMARMVGLFFIIQALCTNYEWGLFKLLPLRTHLFNDYVVSLFLAASPWIFGFHRQPERVWLPHVFLGLLVCLLTWMTQTKPHRVAVHLPV